MKYKKIVIGGLSIILILIFAAFIYIKPIFSKSLNSKEGKTILLIPSQSTFEDVLQIMVDSNLLIDKNTFIKVAKIFGYSKGNVKPGRYLLSENLSYKDLVIKLRSGNQDPHQMVVNNVRTMADLAGKLSSYIEADSITLLKTFTDSEIVRNYGYEIDNFMAMFIPNSYEVFWTTSPEKLLQRMKKEHDIFWNQDRLNKIKERDLTPVTAYILASIVEKESNYKPERPAIAGVYLNRLEQGMKLQADPTVVFATGQFDLRRVLYSHLEFDSPYNTYRYHGLPPGPIYMPSISSLEAVINSEKHEYIFFCAKADNSGIHAFAKNLTEHNKNAAAFSVWLNSNNIK